MAQPTTLAPRSRLLAPQSPCLNERVAPSRFRRFGRSAPTRRGALARSHARAGLVAVAGLAVGALAGAPTRARAGGFEIPDRGARALGRGGATVASVDDPTAVHYNPGALARQRGTRFLYNHSLVFHDARFQRAPLSDAWGEDAGTTFPEARNDRSLFPLGLFAALTTDFGLEHWTFGASVYGPHGVARHDYPEYGPQSFMISDMDVLMAYYGLTAAWSLRDVFGIGVTAQYVDLIRMRYSLVVDATFTPGLDPVPSADRTQITAELDLKDRTGGTAIVGLWGRPHPRVELGLAGRVVPVVLRAEGTMAVDQPTLITDDIRVSFPFTLPATVRGGVRYLHDTGTRTWFDLELAAQWENWSTFDAYDIEIDGRISGQDVDDFRLDKQWRDTVSLRLGGDVHVIPDHLTLRAGGYWESATVPNAYSHLDFPAFMRVGLGGGLSVGGRGVYGTVGYLHVFQPPREVSELDGKTFQQRPLRPCPDRCGGVSGVPANAGTFTSRYDILNLGIELRFGEMRRRGSSTPPPDAPAIPPVAPDISGFDPEPMAPPAAGRDPDDEFEGF